MIFIFCKLSSILVLKDFLNLYQMKLLQNIYSGHYFWCLMFERFFGTRITCLFCQLSIYIIDASSLMNYYAVSKTKNIHMCKKISEHLLVCNIVQ